jgi:hypothetical protein
LKCLRVFHIENARLFVACVKYIIAQNSAVISRPGDGANL